MATPDHFKERRQAKREARKARADRLKKWVPLIKTLCDRYGITVAEIPSGFQLRHQEYIINWWLPTNKIMIQYAGSGETREFMPDGEPGEPKIITAIKKLVEVTRGEKVSTTTQSPS